MSQKYRQKGKTAKIEKLHSLKNVKSAKKKKKPKLPDAMMTIPEELTHRNLSTQKVGDKRAAPSLKKVKPIL